MTATYLSADTLATVLLCAGLGYERDDATPLTNREWNDLARGLIRAGWRPGDLLRWGVAAAREPLSLNVAQAEQIEALLALSVAVAAGIRILSRADDDYPSRWRSRLKEQSPPLLFVAGPLSLLERGGIAAVGSREVDEVGAEFARRVGRAAARAGAPMISGGARGVDREAMFGALEAGGEAIGILPDSLGRSLRAPDVRRAVADGQLVLVSPHRPDARFEIWRAMGRNKLIYSLADVSIVISSEAERGGTWAGATENLRIDWSPLFVRDQQGIPEGNRRLMALGALPLGEDDLDVTPASNLVATLLDHAEKQAASDVQRPSQQPLLSEASGSGRGSLNANHVDGSSSNGFPSARSSTGQLTLLEGL